MPRLGREAATSHSSEFDATRLNCQGHTQQHIAKTLGLSPATSRAFKGTRIELAERLKPQQTLPAMNEPRPARSSTPTSKKFGRFDRVGHRITGDRLPPEATAEASAWSMRMSPSTTTRGSHRKHICRREEESAVAFLESAIAYYQSLCQLRHDRQWDLLSLGCFARACRQLGLKHIRTAPQASNQWKAECFIQTALREWASATAFETSDQRQNQLPHGYIGTTGRPHASLAKKTPISRLGLTRDNVLMLRS
jgi:hypothetical protein